MYKLIFTIAILSLLPVFSLGQSKEKIELNEGLGFYKSGSYQSARKKFDQAYAENPRYTKALYNAGNAAYLNGNFDTAITYYSDYVTKINSENDIAKAHFNIGNAHLQKAQIAESDKERQKEAQAFYKEAIKSYKSSLKYRPNDPETKYNLTYALNKLQKNQQQEQQNKDKNKDDQNKDENKDDQNKSENQEGDKGDKGDPNEDNKDPKKEDDKGDNSEDKKDDKKEGEGDKSEEKEDNNDKNNPQNSKPGEPKNEEPVEGKISRAQAIKDLDAINNEEGKVLQKVYQKKGDKKEKKNSDKDW